MSSPSTDRRSVRSGLTLIEVMIGAMILTFGMLPLLNLSSTTTRTAYAGTRHLLAGQIAASVLDRLSALRFEACRAAATALSGPRSVLADPELVSVLEAGDFGSTGARTIGEDLKRQLRSFEFGVVLEEPRAVGEKGQLFTVVVSVTWLDDGQTQGAKRRYELGMVKFREDL